MAISQQKLREIVFQLLFSQNFTSLEDEIADFMMKQLKVTKKVLKAAESKCREILLKLEEIDLLAEKFSDSYTFQRITEVEKAVLRLAIYELCYVNSLPCKVTISEAIRLTRKFATAESAGFVNAVLDAIYQDQSHLIMDEENNESLAPVSGG
jgi:transcription antitermination protein NusB